MTGAPQVTPLSPPPPSASSTSAPVSSTSATVVDGEGEGAGPATGTGTGRPGVAVPVGSPPPSSAWTAAVRLYLTWLTPISLLIGAVLRIREWLFRRSLWIDEIAVTDNLRARSYGGLLQPLAGQQSAPVGWLWAEKTSVELFGINELALRLVPLLASLVTLAVFPAVARRLAGPTAAPAAVFLLATSPVLIYYASETKQYSSDTTCAVLILLVTLPLLRTAPGWRSATGWGAVCAVLIWCSQPAILVAGVCAACLVLRWARQPTVLGRLAVGLALLVGSLAAEWQVTLRQLSTNKTLEAYWEAFGGYPPRTGGFGKLHWVVSSSTAVIRFVDYSIPVLVVALAGWGLATMLQDRRWEALLLALLGGAAIAAGVTRHYPFAHRLALYLLPAVIVLVCAGLAAASEGPRSGAGHRWRVLAVVVTVIGLAVSTAPAVSAGISKLWRPDEVTAGRQVLRYVADHRQPSDAVLTDIWGITTFNFYGSRIGLHQTGVVAIQPVKAGACPADPLTPLTPTARVWLVLVHHPSAEPADRDAIYASQFAAHATLLMDFHGPGDVAAYLFDLRQQPHSAPAPLATWIKNGCLLVKPYRRR